MVTGTEGMALRTTATPGRNSQRLHINCLPSRLKAMRIEGNQRESGSDLGGWEIEMIKRSHTYSIESFFTLPASE